MIKMRSSRAWVVLQIIISHNRKLLCLVLFAVLMPSLYFGNENGWGGNRIGGGCSKEDIVISQHATAPLPNGIPTYTFEVMNENMSGCSISDIHVSCGSFSTARMINPRVFKRLRYDDCLVNDGEPLPPGRILSFEYASTFPYPLSVSSVSCC